LFLFYKTTGLFIPPFVWEN